MAPKKEMKVRNEKEEFEYVFDIMENQLLAASVHFYIWEQLWPSEKVVDVINQYIGFFQPTRDAHLERLIMKVNDILSSKQEAPSLYRILNMVGRNSSLAPDVNVHEIKQRLRKHRKVLEAIEYFRNKRVAHWDTSVKKLEKPVLFGDTKRMLNELKDISNEISGSHSGRIHAFRYSQQGDVIALIGGLRRKRAEDRRRIERLKRKMNMRTKIDE
jgi:hypothetical protein